MSAMCSTNWARASSVSSVAASPRRICVQCSMRTSGAPLDMMIVPCSVSVSSTDIILRSEVKGTSPTRSKRPSRCPSVPSFFSATRKAPSVGSPTTLHTSSVTFSSASEASVPPERTTVTSSRKGPSRGSASGRPSRSASGATSPSGAYPIPVTTQVPEAVTTSWIVISERVSVPVLSEQMTEAEPRVSTL